MTKFAVCPFCGSSDIVYKHLPGPCTTLPHRYYLECHTCKSRGPTAYSKDKALEKWNIREAKNPRSIDRVKK